MVDQLERLKTALVGRYAIESDPRFHAMLR
jgi:hypothetical protein